MNDVLPAQIGAWQHLEDTVRALLTEYGFEDPGAVIVEHTELFKRATQRNSPTWSRRRMYTFVDQGNDSLTLRPRSDGRWHAVPRFPTACCVAARQQAVVHGPDGAGASGRRKGRYPRQFYQVDVEAIGFTGPDVDIELIAMTARMWRRLGIERVKLNINSLGTPESRQAYREKLITYFRAHESRLDEDSKRRLEGNPLRILDSKNPEMQALVAGAPLLTDSLDPESREHFDTLCNSLTGASSGVLVDNVVNPRLVRGLDYYTRTVFEWITDALGAQDAVCSGGRYDGLIAQLGG